MDKRGMTEYLITLIIILIVCLIIVIFYLVVFAPDFIGKLMPSIPGLP